MKKSDAIKIFGNQSKLAQALGLSKSAVSQWPENLTHYYSDRVIGAAVRIWLDLGVVVLQSPIPQGRTIERRIRTERRRRK